MINIFKLLKNKFVFRLIAVLASAILLSSCASTPSGIDEVNDPFESFNRKTMQFNLAADKYVIRPFVVGYRKITPVFIQDGISSMSHTWKQPVTAVNAVLQGDLNAFAQSTGRFFTNLTLGIFGFFDVASKVDIEAPEKDFGQTLYTWGIKDAGPYIVLPILGPSNVRDTTGRIADFFIDPVDWTLPKSEDPLLLARYAIQAVDTADASSDLLQDIQKTSIDSYTTMRSMYNQNRQKFLTDGDEIPTAPDYDFAFEDDEFEE